MPILWVIVMIIEALLSGYLGVRLARSIGGPKTPIIIKWPLRAFVFMFVFVVVMLVLLVLNAMIGIPINALNTIRDLSR